MNTSAGPSCSPAVPASLRERGRRGGSGIRKVGRNERCPYGKGRKCKHCCLRPRRADGSFGGEQRLADEDIPAEVVEELTCTWRTTIGIGPRSRSRHSKAASSGRQAHLRTKLVEFLAGGPRVIIGRRCGEMSLRTNLRGCGSCRPPSGRRFSGNALADDQGQGGTIRRDT